MRHTVYVEPARQMRAPGFEWDHEIQVALPASYYNADRADETYPVLWMTDGSQNFDLAVGVVQLLNIYGDAPEMIIVGVGCPRDTSHVEHARRRIYDFCADEDPTPAAEWPGRDIMVSLAAAAGVSPGDMPGGGAPAFLDFLVDDVRKTLSAEYRMDPDDHGLFGHSGGGHFVGYALFARPGDFAKYICSSPNLEGCDGRIFEMEKEYAAEHDDLRTRVFFGAGEKEIDDYGMATMPIVSSMIRMREILSLRGYRSLEATSRIFPGESHVSVPPLTLSWGIRTLWADCIHPRTFGESMKYAAS